MEKKTVSVVMYTYNGERFLREQMDSILAQTYPIHEIIISDDCSTDGTIDILREYAAKHTFIKIHQNARNIGFNSNFYHAFNRATGEYIAISDQDDIWSTQKVEKLIEKITLDKKYNLCFSHSTFSDSQQINQIPSPLNAEALLFNNCIPGHAMLLKKEFITNLPLWKNIGFYYDWWLIMNAALENSVVECKESLVWHRIYNEAASVSITQKIKKQKKSSLLLPYIIGFYHFLQLRKTYDWFFFYQNIYKKTSTTNHPALHKISKYLIGKHITDIFWLCLACMKYRHKIYPSIHKQNKIMFLVRSFCTPFICSYYNLQFYNTCLQENKHHSNQ